MTERLTIDRVAHFGDGVAIESSANVYVPYTLPGEVVDVLPAPGQHPDRRILGHVVQPSPDRIEPFCPHFGACGGCAIQHWRMDAYRQWKRQIVVDTISQAGIACEIGELI